MYDVCARQSLKWNKELTPRPRVEAGAREGEREWLVAHVWSSWSLVSQVKLSWTRSLCTASSWSTPSKGAALAMLGTIGDAARTILVGDEPSIRSPSPVVVRSISPGQGEPALKDANTPRGVAPNHLYLV